MVQILSPFHFNFEDVEALGKNVGVGSKPILGATCKL
jgi:hypothetical protein